MSTFNPNIPNPTDKLSNSQPVLKTNNQALDAIFGRNHYKYSLNDGSQGKHQFIELPVQGAIPAPVPGLIATEGTLYTKGNPPDMYYTPGVSGNEYRLTACNTGNFPKFGTYLAYGSPPAQVKYTGGWTFLPGGLILQYGSHFQPTAFSVGSSSGTTPFPRTFTTKCFTVQTQLYGPSSISKDYNLYVKNDEALATPATTPTTSQFQWINHVIGSSPSGIGGFYWYAIGI